MSLQQIKNMKEQKGFTIVELLIVIVVIGILAAIVIVAFNGIQNRAKATKASGLASSVMKKAEAYNAEEGRYPLTTAEITGAATTKSYWMSSNDLLTTTTLSSTNGETNVQWATCPASATATTITGVRISYWDYNNNRATTASTNPASFVAGSC